VENCVLLQVESDDPAAFLFRLALDEANITSSVYRVLSPKAALEFLRNEGAYERAKRPRLVVSNLTFQEGGGWMLLRELQADPGLRTIPVVLTGAEPSAQVQPKALAAGAYAYIEKPFDYAELFERVRVVCRDLLCD
jgi:CheY-like chemotaxis protein